MAKPAPSQFAALLRRSKFASYDPKIGQVYTTFDGDAARGNFGLKRPLALRRRNAHITIKAVDSREQQTVWKSAEPQNRWMRMWDEVGITPQILLEGPWGQNLGPRGEYAWDVDSEFAPPKRLAKDVDGEKGTEAGTRSWTNRSEATANIDAMSDEQFERYLDKLKTLRPAFQEYLAARKGDQSLWSGSLHYSGDTFNEFLQTVAYDEYHSSNSRRVEQQPHRYAGLSYTRSPRLQDLYLKKPHVGRVLNKAPSENRSKHLHENFVVASAGVTSTLPRKQHDPHESPVKELRFSNALLVDAPVVVGSQVEALEGTSLETSVSALSDDQYDARANPYTPGTREYVGHEHSKIPEPVASMTVSAVLPELNMDVNHQLAATGLLGTLNSLRGAGSPTSPSKPPDADTSGRK